MVTILKGKLVGIAHSFLASGDFWRLLITFANSLDPDQDRQNVLSVLIWIQTVCIEVQSDCADVTCRCYGFIPLLEKNCLWVFLRKTQTTFRNVSAIYGIRPRMYIEGLLRYYMIMMSQNHAHTISSLIAAKRMVTTFHNKRR